MDQASHARARLRRRGTNGDALPRSLTACGAEVLRVDDPGSDESAGPFKRVPDDLMLAAQAVLLDTDGVQARECRIYDGW